LKAEPRTPGSYAISKRRLTDTAFRIDGNYELLSLSGSSGDSNYEPSFSFGPYQKPAFLSHSLRWVQAFQIAQHHLS
jgi:hypothetical protein